MNITLEQFETPADINKYLSSIQCEESCMIEKRKEKGLPEIEDCPELQDIDTEVIISVERYRELMSISRINYKFKKSIFYKLYNWFN